jgi:hypothetical protein
MAPKSEDNLLLGDFDVFWVESGYAEIIIVSSILIYTI